jgi:chemotaxis protein methyltransferase CheR
MSASDERQVRELRDFLLSLGFAWRGFRKKRRRVGARLRRRMAELGCVDFAAYRERIATDSTERRRLHQLLGITISRFFRDRVDWELLEKAVLRRWHASRGGLRAWSMGCASGEEPYTLRMLWLSLAGTPRDDTGAMPLDDSGRPGSRANAHRAGAKTELDILATDVKPELITRARTACYPLSAARHVPPQHLARHMRIEADSVRPIPAVCQGVRFRIHDYLQDPWPSGFDLILARNGLFTYRSAHESGRHLERLASALRPQGVLFVGSNDQLPERIAGSFQRMGRTLWRLKPGAGA